MSYLLKLFVIVTRDRNVEANQGSGDVGPCNLNIMAAIGQWSPENKQLG